MKKKLTALALVVVMVAMLFTGLTMAYFTDNDSATNTFTVGNVDIDVKENDTEDNLNFENVVPGIEYEKEVTVKNDGKNDAYLRVTIEMPDYLTPVWAENSEWTITGPVNGVYTATYNGIFEAGDTTEPCLKAVELKSDLERTDIADEKFEVIVKAEAIQADGLTKAEAMAILDNAGDPLTAVEVEVAGTTDEEKAASLAATLAANSTTQKIVVNDAESVWETGAGHGSTPLVAEDADTQLVEFNGGTFKATGSGVGPIRAANEGTLVFKNMTIVDESVSYAENSWEFGYLEFDGNLYFENCTFKNAIMVSGDATFVNCTFDSHKDNEYAVWVDGGSASFSGCTFEGARGLKMHEAYGSDVKSVIVDDCTFNGLTKKPGVAIGDLEATTVVTIQNSEFINCQAGDQGLYIYETDTDVTTFVFTESDNIISNS